MQIKIPLGSEINRLDKNIVKIRVPNTQYWVLGEKTGKTWNTYLIDSESTYKKLIRKNFTTKAFAIFSETILNTPLPYQG